jgi:hypothetical protein
VTAFSYSHETGQLAGALLVVESMLELGFSPADVQSYASREIAAHRARMASYDAELSARITANPMFARPEVAEGQPT